MSIDCGIPGWIDLQVNGFADVDFSSSDLTFESMIMACRKLIQSGTIGFLPTMITSSSEIYKRNLSIISQVADQPEFQKHILGIHMEGPHISTQPGALGCHNENYVTNPDIALYDNFQEWSNNKIKMVTIAAELPNAEEYAHYVSIKEL